MDILSQAKSLSQQGKSICHMEVGEPDFATADCIVDTGIEALKQFETHYTPATGLPELRVAIADYYDRKFSVQINPGRIIITPGASGALQLAISCLLDVGDNILLTDPGYPCNKNIAQVLGVESISIPVSSDSNYQLNADLIARHWNSKTRAAIVATPSNPTGTVLPEKQLKELCEIVEQKKGVLIVDEIYQGLVYDIEPTTVLSINQAVDSNVVVINSFSKYFQMTGWRLGWCVVPSTLVKACDHLAQNLFLAAPTTAQYAALAAFLPETLQLLEERRAIFKQRRDYLLPQLRKLGFEIPIIPQGAFYIYCDCSKLLAKPGILKKQLKTSMDLAHDLLETRGVAVTPGIDFGRHKADQYLRIAYTKDIRQLEAAVARLTDYLNEVS